MERSILYTLDSLDSSSEYSEVPSSWFARYSHFMNSPDCWAESSSNLLIRRQELVHYQSRVMQVLVYSFLPISKQSFERYIAVVVLPRWLCGPESHIFMRLAAKRACVGWAGWCSGRSPKPINDIMVHDDIMDGKQQFWSTKGLDTQIVVFVGE